MTTFATEKRIPHPFARVQLPPPIPSGEKLPLPPTPPTHEQIARRAYDIYIAHGRTDGRSEMDWRQAEEELAHAALAARHKFETQFGY
jgi:hypothetical protein